MWLEPTLFLLWFMDGHLGSFYLATILANAVLGTHVHIFVRTCVFISRNGIAGPGSRCASNHRGNFQAVF